MPDATGPSIDPDVTGADAGPVRGSWLRLLADRADVLGVIALGGAVGSLARWGVGRVVPHQLGEFAWSTFLLNVVGCLALGGLMVLVLEVWPPTRLVRPFLAVGVLGGLTTFSTYALDAAQMLALRHSVTAAAYLFGTLAAALFASWVGVVGTRRVVERRHARALARRPARAPRKAALDDPDRTGTAAHRPHR